MYPGVTKIYSLGNPFDMQLDNFVVHEWGYNDNLSEEEIPNWIQFKNETISDGLNFVIAPTI